VSIAWRTPVYVPATGYVCSIVFETLQGVSQTPSPSQSHRTRIALGGSWSSHTLALNVNTVDVFPVQGVQVTFPTYGGEFGGGGGGL